MSWTSLEITTHESRGEPWVMCHYSLGPTCSWKNDSRCPHVPPPLPHTIKKILFTIKRTKAQHVEEKKKVPDPARAFDQTTLTRNCWALLQCVAHSGNILICTFTLWNDQRLAGRSLSRQRGKSLEEKIKKKRLNIAVANTHSLTRLLLVQILLETFIKISLGRRTKLVELPRREQKRKATTNGILLEKIKLCVWECLFFIFLNCTVLPPTTSHSILKVKTKQNKNNG